MGMAVQDLLKFLVLSLDGSKSLLLFFLSQFSMWSRVFGFKKIKVGIVVSRAFWKIDLFTAHEIQQPLGRPFLKELRLLNTLPPLTGCSGLTGRFLSFILISFQLLNLHGRSLYPCVFLRTVLRVQESQFNSLSSRNLL